MPINLNDIDINAIQDSRKYTMKNWVSQITGGDNKARGLFNANNPTIKYSKYLKQANKVSAGVDSGDCVLVDELFSKLSPNLPSKINTNDIILDLKSNVIKQFRLDFRPESLPLATPTPTPAQINAVIDDDLAKRLADYDNLTNPKSDNWHKINKLSDNNIDFYIRPIIRNVIVAKKGYQNSATNVGAAYQTLDVLIQCKPTSRYSKANQATIFSVENHHRQTKNKISWLGNIDNTLDDAYNQYAYLADNVVDIQDFEDIIMSEKFDYDSIANTNAKINDAVKNLDLMHNLFDYAFDQIMMSAKSISDVLTFYSENFSNYINKFNKFVGPIEIDIEPDIFNQFNKLIDKYDGEAKKYPKIDVDLIESKTQQFKNLNLRVLLASFLKQLAENKNDLHHLSINQTAIDKVKASTKYSNAQKELILADGPLVIGSAGAGSGKTHTLTGRLNYMQACGEDLSKTMVLSFTNVAADTVRNRFGDIRSITLADLFNQIYSVNFEHQRLATDKTIQNSLQLVALGAFDKKFSKNTNVPRIKKVATQLAIVHEPLVKTNRRIKHNVVIQNILTIINNNYESVIEILNAIGSTSLFLQPIILFSIICNNNRPMLKVPQEFINIENIITDESQDISTFEYVLLITLTLIYKSSLCVIGDGSQTLYEFRNSNPQFLNALESSGIFDIYKLSINYRSNDEILALANKFLSVIDANRYAKIQLHSDNLTNITEKSFKDKVKIMNWERFDTDNKINANQLAQDSRIIDYVLTNYDNGQLALLAYRRIDTMLLYDVVKTILLKHRNITLIDNRYNNNVSNVDALFLMKSRNVEINLLTDVCSNIYNNDMRKLIATTPKESIAVGERIYKKFTEQVNERILNMLNSKSVKVQKSGNALNKTIKQAPPIWTNYLVASLSKPNLTHLEIFNMVYESVQNVENQINNQIQLIKNSNVDTVIANNIKTAKIIVSTIHGSKGLEFEHALIYHTESNDYSQEMLRLYGVALTRPKFDELIINVPCSTTRNGFNSSIAGMFQSPVRTAQALVLDELKPKKP